MAVCLYMTYVCMIYEWSFFWRICNLDYQFKFVVMRFCVNVEWQSIYIIYILCMYTLYRGTWFSSTHECHMTHANLALPSFSHSFLPSSSHLPSSAPPLSATADRACSDLISNWTDDQGHSCPHHAKQPWCNSRCGCSQRGRIFLALFHVFTCLIFDLVYKKM